MAFLMTLLVTAIAVLLLRVPIKKLPWLFYLLAIAASALTVYLYFLPAVQRPDLLLGCFFIMRRGYIALSLFIVVMFTGVFDEESKPFKLLIGIRAELSIIATALIAGHLIPYLSEYLQQIFAHGFIQTNIAFAVALSLALLLILMVLTITSFKIVKRKMNAALWKNIQRLAYIFFILILLHQSSFLLLPALKGSVVAIVNIAIFATVTAAYVALRTIKAIRNARSQNDRATTGADNMAANT